MEDNIILSDSEDRQKQIPEIDINLTNVVSTFSTSCHIDLRTLAMRGINVTYRKEKGMVSMMLMKPKVTANIWSSGKVACTGCSSLEEAYHCSKYVAKLIKNLGFNVTMRKYRVVNILALSFMPYNINILEFAKAFQESKVNKKEPGFLESNITVSYEPELHPGANIMVKDPKASVKVFTTGSITITASNTEKIQKAVELTYDLVSKYWMPKPPGK